MTPSGPGIQYLGLTKPVFQVEGGVLVRGNFKLSPWDTAMDVSRLVWLINSKWGTFLSPTTTLAETGIDGVSACLESMRTLAEHKGRGGDS